MAILHEDHFKSAFGSEFIFQSDDLQVVNDFISRGQVESFSKQPLSLKTRGVGAVKITTGTNGDGGRNHLTLRRQSALDGDFV